MNLLEAKECTFEDVFSAKGKFHCFTLQPHDRERAIEEFNDAYVKHELREMFSAEQQKQELETGEGNKLSAESDKSVDEVTTKFEKL